MTVVGAPFDEFSSFKRGAAKAPSRIREVLHDGSANLTTERGLDLAVDSRWEDVGDLALGNGRDAFPQIEAGVEQLLSKDQRVLVLGGDHAITYPVMRAVARHHPRVSILHFDAHPDIYDIYEGNPLSHACPFARIMEESLAHRLVQVGIRTATPHQREQWLRFGVEAIEMKDFRPEVELRFDGPVYVSFDIDVLDPAFAPGVSHHEPGGMSVRDALGVLHRFHGTVVGADIVEFNPDRDPTGITAAVGSKLYKELLSLLLK